MSGYEFKKVELIGGDELIWSGAFLAAAKKRLAADGIDPDFKSSFVTSAGYGTGLTSSSTLRSATD